MFDKQEYWKNRKAGKRGQGELAAPKVIGEKQGGHMSMHGSKIVYLNRKESRQRVTNRDYTKPNYGYRTHRDKVPFTGHERNTSKNPPLELPKYPSVITNHQRMLTRKATV